MNIRTLATVLVLTAPPALLAEDVPPSWSLPGVDNRPRWYWQPDDLPEIAEFIRQHMPDAYKAALADAEEIMNHRFPNSCAATVVERVQLTPDFSFMDNPTGDRQFLYTMHRHRFWEELGIAYALTHDDRYAQEWARQLRRWLDECPLPITDPEVRKNEMWSGLDVGIRAFTWTWPYHCFAGSPAFATELRERWLKHWAEHARFLRKYHAPPLSNWCAMQMYGLLSIALTFPELKGSDAWRDYAVETLTKAIRTQIRPDGVQVEQSPSYHVGCVLWFFEPMHLGQLNRITWPADYRDRLENMCEFVGWITAPDGLLPALSDTDRNRQGLAALATGAILFNRADFAARAEPTPRHVFIHGVQPVRRLLHFPRPTPTTGPAEQRVRHFPYAGYVVMRSGWDDQAGFAVFDCGPRGHWHGHYDLLNLEIHAFGKLLIADPGRWWYDDSDLRRELLSTPAHNTISLDGQSHTGFETNDHNQYEMVKVESRHGWTYVHGRHRAYDKMEAPPLCQRQVLYDGRNTWVVIDRVDSPRPHDVLVNYQFAEQPVRRVSPTAVSAGRPGQAQVLLLHEARDGLTAELEPAVLSRVYGHREPATRLRLRQRGNHLRIVTAIHAFHGPQAPPASLDTHPNGGPLTEIRLGLGSKATIIRLGPGGGRWSVRPGT